MYVFGLVESVSKDVSLLGFLPLPFSVSLSLSTCVCADERESEQYR